MTLLIRGMKPFPIPCEGSQPSLSANSSDSRRPSQKFGIDTPISEVFYKGGARHEITTPKYALMSTHAGRRTFICKALSMNIPPEVVMKWTGHSDYKAMKPYIAVADKVKADAMKLFDK